MFLIWNDLSLEKSRSLKTYQMKHYLYPFSGDIIVDHCNYAQMEVLTANSPFIEVWGKKKGYGQTCLNQIVNIQNRNI